MFQYNLEEAYNEWNRIPVDDFAYMEPEELLILSPNQFKELVELASFFRWNINEWRNYENAYLDFMNLEKVANKVVMDFGCGLGLDGAIFACNKASVVLADLHPKILKIAEQTLIRSSGHIPLRLLITTMMSPYFIMKGIDVFWSFGVIHHTPLAKDVLRQACLSLNPDGECRIGLYSDKRWVEMMQEPVPNGLSHEHPRFMEFVRKCDTVGIYADWYNEEKIKNLVEDFAIVTECRYMCKDQMIGVVIKPKPIPNVSKIENSPETSFSTER